MQNDNQPWRFGVDWEALPEPDEEGVKLAIEHIESAIRQLSDDERAELEGMIFGECLKFYRYEQERRTAPRQSTVTKRLKRIAETSAALLSQLQDADHFTLLALDKGNLMETQSFGLAGAAGIDELDLWYRQKWANSLLSNFLNDLSRIAGAAADSQPRDIGGRGSLVPGTPTWELVCGCVRIFEGLGCSDKVTGSVERTFGIFVAYVLSAASGRDANPPEREIKAIAKKYRALKAAEAK